MSENFPFLSEFIAITIPLLFVVVMIDNYVSRRIILYFCWGLFAGMAAFSINNFLGDSVSQAERMTLSIAPMIEEICKGLPVLLFLNSKKYPKVTKLIIFCALASGIGFSVQESLYYFSVSTQEFTDIIMLLIRTLTTSLMHGITTALFGVGLLLLNKQKQIIMPLIFGLFAFCASIHALYNLLLQTNFAAFAMMTPIILFFAFCIFVRKSSKPAME